MNILFIASTDDSLGGAKSLLELVGELTELGIRVTVVNPSHNSLNEKLSSMGVENYSLGYRLCICRDDVSRPLFVIKYLLKLVLYCYGLVKAIERINYLQKKGIIDFRKYSCVHTNNSVEDIGAYISKKYNIPHLWHLREFGDKDFSFVYFHRNMGEYISQHADKCIAVSDVVRDSWVEKGVPGQMITVITHGVDGNGIKPSKHDGQTIKIVFSGNITPEKGQEGLIRSIARFDIETRNRIQVDIFGSGKKSYLKEIEHLINECELESTVELKGYSNSLKELLPEYDIGIVNSKCEAMGRVTCEYMFAGLCVLASNSGANVELLDYGQAGVLFDRDDPNDLSRKLQVLLADKNKIQEYGTKARRRAAEHFDIKKNVNMYISLYEDLQDGTN